MITDLGQDDYAESKDMVEDNSLRLDKLEYRTRDGRLRELEHRIERLEYEMDKLLAQKPEIVLEKRPSK